MKRIIILLILLGHCQHFYAFLTSGSLIGENVEPNDIVRYRVQFVEDRVLYTNGGLTYLYPFSFLTTPQVIVSVELLASFNPAITYVPIIEISSSSSVIIRVNKITDNGINTTVTEAATNEVLVNIFASGS